MTDLHKADANDNLRKPIGYLEAYAKPACLSLSASHLKCFK
jgi:hypothetical protein